MIPIVQGLEPKFINIQNYVWETVAFSLGFSQISIFCTNCRFSFFSELVSDIFFQIIWKDTLWNTVQVVSIIHNPCDNCSTAISTQFYEYDQADFPVYRFSIYFDMVSVCNTEKWWLDIYYMFGYFLNSHDICANQALVAYACNVVHGNKSIEFIKYFCYLFRSAKCNICIIASRDQT